MIVHLRTVLLLASFTLMGCANNGIGYGVMLWSPNPSAIPNGALVLIKSEIRSKKEYTLAYSSQELTVDTWRVSFHHLKKDALKESKNFAKVHNLFAESLKADLPVRSSMDNYTNNNILYRLGEGEIAKVINEPSKELKVGNLTGRWYEILSQTGYRGYVFDYYLYIFDIQQTQNSENTLETDPNSIRLNSWSNKTWYPYYYSFMCRNRAIVLPLFNLSYGLAFLPHQKKILLTLPSLQLQISYLNTLSQNTNEITFVEPKVRIEEVNSQELRVHFSYAGKTHCETFITFAGDIKALRERQEKELERLWNQLSIKRKLISDIGGQLILNPDKTYIWQKPPSFKNDFPISLEQEEGHFDLEKGMVSNLQNSYKGVLTLYPTRKDTKKESEPVSFLIDYSPNFLQLVYIPQENFYYGVANKESLNTPTFTFKREEIK